VAPLSSTALLQPRSCAAVPAHFLSPDSQLQQLVQVSISPQPIDTPDNSVVLVQLSPFPLRPAAMHFDSPMLMSAAALLERGESGGTQAPTLALQLQQSDGSPSALGSLDRDSASLSTSPAAMACASFRSIASASDRPQQLTQGAFLSPSPDVAIAVHALGATMPQKTLKQSRRALFPQGGACVVGSAAASGAAAAAAAAVAATSVSSCAQPAWQTPIELTRHLSTLLAPVEDLFSSFPAFFTPSAASAAMSHWVAMQRVLLVHPDLQQARLLERQRSATCDPPYPYTPIPAMLFGGALSANSSLLALLLADVAEQRPAPTSSCESHQERLRALADLRRRLLDLERDPLCGAVKPHLLKQQDLIAREYGQVSVQATICSFTPGQLLSSSAPHLCSVRRVWCILQRQEFFDAMHGRQDFCHV